MSLCKRSNGLRSRLSVLEELRQQLEAELGPETNRGIRHALQLMYGVHTCRSTRSTLPSREQTYLGAP